jgi:peptide/nickel transport system permease protein
VDEITLVMIKDPQTMFAALKSGEIDGAARALPPELVAEWKNDPAIEIVQAPTLWGTWMQMNLNDPLFNNRDLRYAISLAVDGDTLVDRVMLGRAQSGKHGWPHLDSTWTKPGMSVPYDVEQAKAGLDAVGMVDKDGDGSRDKPDGTPIDFRIVVSTNQPLYVRAAEIMVEQLAAVGLKSHVEAVDTATFNNLTADGNYEFSIAEITPHGLADQDQYLQFYSGAQMKKLLEGEPSVSRSTMPGGSQDPRGAPGCPLRAAGIREPLPEPLHALVPGWPVRLPLAELRQLRVDGRLRHLPQVLVPPGRCACRLHRAGRNGARRLTCLKRAVRAQPVPPPLLPVPMFYYLRIIGQYALALFAALTINFLLPRLAPGDPLNSLLGTDTAETLSEAAKEQIRMELGLGGPLHEQFVHYLGGILSGNFGDSAVLGMPVWDAIAQRLPWTLLLMGCALVISSLLGTVLGVLSAWRRGETIDVATMTTVLFFGSLPPFWVAMMLIILFSTTLGWLPSFGAYQLGTSFPDWSWFVGVGKRLVMPVAALVIVQSASVLLIARSSMQIAQEQDYVTFARSRGVSERRIFFGHAFRNALLPLYTHVMLGLGSLVGGALVIETVFTYPGLGSLVVMGVNSRDYLLLQGIFIFASLSIIAANFITDLFYPLIDPRTRRAR